MKAKGNVFKNKRVLVEHIYKAQIEKSKEKELADQAEARRQKNRQLRERRAKKVQEVANKAEAEKNAAQQQAAQKK